MRNVRNKLEDVKAMMTSREGTLFTYALAYSLVTGIAPFLIIIVVYMGTYIYNAEQIITVFQRYIPSDLIMPFVKYIKATEMSSPWFIISLLGISIWVASKSVYSFLLLSSEHDDIPISNFVLRILAMVYFVLIILGVAVVFVLIGYFPRLNSYVLPLLTFVFFLFVYRLLTFRYTRFSDVVYGSIFSSLSVTVLGRFFFRYINQYSNYQTIYGPLSSLMIMLISAWFIAWVVYCGYVINYVFRHDDGKVKEKDLLIHYLGKHRKD